MSTLKEIQGRNIKSVSSDPSSAEGGDIWYNSTSQTLKGVVASGAWSAGGNLITQVYATAAAGASTQNAGLGFALNPLTSLCIPYKIDLLLIVGHRHTLPQHKIMGEIDKSILDIIGWDNYIFVEK